LGPIWIPKAEKKTENGGKRQSARKIMEEKLIIAVSGFPELYDSTLFVYRDVKKILGGRLQTSLEYLLSCRLLWLHVNKCKPQASLLFQQ